MKIKGALQNTIIAVIGLVMSGYAWISSVKFPTDAYTGISSAFFPRIMATCLAACCVALLIKTFVMKKESEFDSITLKDRRNREVLIGIILAFIFVETIKPVGFLVVSPIYMFLMMWLLEYRKLKISIPVAVVFPVVVYLLFRNVLKIMLPLGIMKGWF